MKLKIPTRYQSVVMGITYIVLALLFQGAIMVPNYSSSNDPWFVVCIRAILPHWSPSFGLPLSFVPTAPVSIFQFFMLAQGSEQLACIATRPYFNVLIAMLNFILWFWIWKRAKRIGVVILCAVSVAFFAGTMFERQVAYDSTGIIAIRIVPPWSDQKSHCHPTFEWVPPKQHGSEGRWVHTYYGFGLIECLCEHILDEKENRPNQSSEATPKPGAPQ